MRVIALFLSILTVIGVLCSCSKVKQELNDPIKRAGEIITAPPKQTEEPDTAEGTGDETDAQTEEADPRSRNDGSLGCAGTIDGRTIVISIFANDTNTSWINNAEDASTRGQILNSLKLACDWLTAEAQKYGKSAEFFCDWTADQQLAYNIAFNANMVTTDASTYSLIAKTLTSGLNTAAIQKKYDAEDVIYLFFYNTLPSNPVLPMSLTHVDSKLFNIEFAMIPARFEETRTVTATYLANELLHFFGAYDIVHKDDKSPIPQEYVDYCFAANSNDIMYKFADGDEIASEIGPLTAYYIGLADECDDVAEWQLPTAERFLTK